MVIFLFVSRGCARYRGLTPAFPLTSLRDSNFARNLLDNLGFDATQRRIETHETYGTEVPCSDVRFAGADR